MVRRLWLCGTSCVIDFLISAARVVTLLTDQISRNWFAVRSQFKDAHLKLGTTTLSKRSQANQVGF